jgi:hypothetical protein
MLSITFPLSIKTFFILSTLQRVVLAFLLFGRSPSVSYYAAIDRLQFGFIVIDSWLFFFLSCEQYIIMAIEYEWTLEEFNRLVKWVTQFNELLDNEPRSLSEFDDSAYWLRLLDNFFLLHEQHVDAREREDFSRCRDELKGLLATLLQAARGFEARLAEFVAFTDIERN